VEIIEFYISHFILKTQQIKWNYIFWLNC